MRNVTGSGKVLAKFSGMKALGLTRRRIAKGRRTLAGIWHAPVVSLAKGMSDQRTSRESVAPYGKENENSRRMRFCVCYGLPPFLFTAPVPLLLLLLLVLPACKPQDNPQDYTCVTNKGAFVQSPLAKIRILPARFTWRKIEDTITITKYIGTNNTVTIPSAINGLRVASIGNGAFSNCSNLTSVTIPKSVTSIKYRAFERCTNLARVTIPNSVTNIGEWAFTECTKLAIINIPNGITYIAGGAFRDCTNLTGIIIPSSVTSIGSDAFFNCSSLTNLIIPDRVMSLGFRSFAYCDNLTNVTMGRNVTYISGEAFRSCRGLAKITMGNNVTNIGHWTFVGCTNLKEVHFKGNAPTIGPDVFLNATNAIIYYLPGTTGWGTIFGGRLTTEWKP